MLTLMAVSQVLLLALLGTPSVATETGTAAIYGQPGDTMAGGPLACSGQPLHKGDLVCAHRTLPCGTNVLVQSLRSQRFATCRVLDRGPFGARLPTGKFVIKKRADQPGRWRAIVDMTPDVAKTLHAHDIEPVRLIYLRPGLRPGTLTAFRTHPDRLPHAP